MPMSPTQNPWNAGQSAWGNPATRSPRRPRPQQMGQPGQSMTLPNAPPPAAPTFAQLQAQGTARPAPPASAAPQQAQPFGQPASLVDQTQSALSQQPALTLAPGSTGPTQAPPPASTVGAPPPGGTFTGTNPDAGGIINRGSNPTRTSPGAGGPGGDPGTAAPRPSAISGSLLAAVQDALARGGSRYGLPEVQKVRGALQSQLASQFGAQQQQLDEQMARRGISASTIAKGYYGDLYGQQANALAGLDASLIQDSASTNAADLSAALGAGQNLYNTDTQSGLANRQLDMQGGQFGQNLAQQLQLALMGDRTANRGLDIQGQLAQNDLMLRVAQTLASLGFPTNGTGTGTTPGNRTAAPAPGANPTVPTNNPFIPHNPGAPPVPAAPSAPVPPPNGGGVPGNPDVAPFDDGTIFTQTPNAPMGPGNAGAPNVPGAGTPNAPNGPIGPSGPQQGPTAPAGFGVNTPSPNAATALMALESMTGVPAARYGFDSNATAQQIDAIRGIMSAIGNRQPDAIEAGKNHPNAFVRRTAWSYALGFGSQGLPAQVAQSLGLPPLGSG